MLKLDESHRQAFRIPFRLWCSPEARCFPHGNLFWPEPIDLYNCFDKAFNQNLCDFDLRPFATCSFARHAHFPPGALPLNMNLTGSFACSVRSYITDSPRHPYLDILRDEMSYSIENGANHSHPFKDSTQQHRTAHHTTIQRRARQGRPRLQQTLTQTLTPTLGIDYLGMIQALMNHNSDYELSGRRLVPRTHGIGMYLPT